MHLNAPAVHQGVEHLEAACVQMADERWDDTWLDFKGNWLYFWSKMGDSTLYEKFVWEINLYILVSTTEHGLR